MKKIKRRKTILFIILFVILFIIISVAIYAVKITKEEIKQQKELQQKKEQVSSYTKVDEFKSIEEVLVYLDSEFIEQQNAEEENLDYIVKAKLKYGLDLKHKNYYEKLIEYSASATGYKNFCIIDEEKRINIIVLCNNSKTISSYYINNEIFYFEKLESKGNIEKTTNINITKINNVCSLLQQLCMTNWYAVNINLGTKDSTYKGYDIYFDEGLEVRKINAKIFNIIFNEKYQNDIVEGLTVNSTREEIINKLGKPSFENGLCIGYKTEKFYIFFSEKQISIYPVIQYTTDEIIPIIEEYEKNHNYSELINGFREKWNDYDVLKSKENNIVLQYTLKGLKIVFDDSSTQGIVLYNNYNGKIDKDYTIEDVKNKTIDFPSTMNFVNEDLVFTQEMSRINLLDNYTKKDNFACEKVLNISNKFKLYEDINSNEFCFVSINKQVPNSELRENFTTGIWYENNKFIYSIKNKGIYIYYPEERRYKTLIQGTEEFKIIKIEDNKLYYDEKIIEL